VSPGRTDAIGPAADLYALGCVAHSLLMVRLVFLADTPLGLTTAPATDTPRKPSRGSELEIPPELDAIVLRCLAKKTAERPRRALALAEQLRSVPFARPWDAGRAKSWWDVAPR
jgi:serine/threonine protein kinase